MPLHDKVKALGILAKYLGLLRERVDVSGAIGVGLLPRGFFESIVMGDPSLMQLPPEQRALPPPADEQMA